jgi:hypothetical protein
VSQVFWGGGWKRTEDAGAESTGTGLKSAISTRRIAIRQDDGGCIFFLSFLEIGLSLLLCYSLDLSGLGLAGPRKAGMWL